MSKWREVRFDSFITLKRGYDLPLTKTKEGKFPVIASTDLRGTHIEYKAKKPVITVGRSGSIGNVQFINHDAWPLNTTLYLKNDKGNNRRFIYYYLKTMQLENFNSGAGVPTLNRNHLHSLKIKIPDLKTQEKIVDILSTYDELIENNNRRIEILEKSAEEIYKEWFVRMRFPGYENTKFIKGIPEAWEVKRVKDLGEVITGKTPSTKKEEYYGGNIMFVKTPDMNNNTFVINTEVYLSNDGSDSQALKLLPKNSIMVNCIGVNAGESVSLNIEEAHTNQQINSIVLEDAMYREWVYLTVKNLKGIIKLTAATGATMPNLSKGKFERLKILFPTNEIIKEFNNNTKDIFENIKVLMLNNQNLIKQRDLLLPRLMNGTIEVK